MRDVDALHALDRLNRYARVPTWAVPGPRRIVSHEVIYGFKAQAIRVLSAQQRATHRRVTYRATCTTCGGSGWWSRRDGKGCWTCGGWQEQPGAGSKVLRFVETTFPETGSAAGAQLDLFAAPAAPAMVWHSPADHDVGAELWRTLADVPGDTGTWKPRQPGVPLEAHVAVELLLLVEDWLLPTFVAVPPRLQRYGLDLPPDVASWTERAVVAWRERHPAAPLPPDDDIPF